MKQTASNNAGVKMPGEVIRGMGHNLATKKIKKGEYQLKFRGLCTIKNILGYLEV